MSGTPKKDKYRKQIDNIDQSKKYTDTNKIEIGDYVGIPQSRESSGVSGFVIKKGSKNIIIQTPYGGYGDSDYIDILEIKANKKLVTEFYKPKK